MCVCVWYVSALIRRGSASLRKPCRFGVMDRYAEDASGIQWMETDACYNYHTMNAWDDP